MNIPEPEEILIRKKVDEIIRELFQRDKSPNANNVLLMIEFIRSNQVSEDDLQMARHAAKVLSTLKEKAYKKTMKVLAAYLL